MQGTGHGACDAIGVSCSFFCVHGTDVFFQMHSRRNLCEAPHLGDTVRTEEILVHCAILSLLGVD